MTMLYVCLNCRCSRETDDPQSLSSGDEHCSHEWELFIREEKPPVHVVEVHLGPNEWDSSGIMAKVAEEVLRSTNYQEQQPLLCWVYEHGGWWLVYALIGDKVQIVLSANDVAIYPKDVHHWKREHLDGAKYVHLTTVRRQ